MKAGGDSLKPSLVHGVHPLISRILLGAAAPMKAVHSPLLQALQQRRSLFNPLPLIPTSLRSKRTAKEEEVFVKPHPYESFTPAPVARPSLFARYHAMSSDEKADHHGKILEKIMHGVKIVGHIDGFLTKRAKSGIKKIHGLFASEER